MFKSFDEILSGCNSEGAYRRLNCLGSRYFVRDVRMTNFSEKPGINSLRLETRGQHSPTTNNYNIPDEGTNQNLGVINIKWGLNGVQSDINKLKIRIDEQNHL